MIKQKAPKDMTVTEYIDLVEKRYHTEEPTNMNAWINTLRMIAEEPAPNPFTPDQLAWMREEQRNGFNYAATCMEDTCVFEKAPEKVHGFFVKNHVQNKYACRSHSFLSDILSADDPEPLCFADYAPLEEK